MNIGSLEFEFLANVARLRQDMDEVKKAVGGATDFVSDAASRAKMLLGGLATGLSVGAFSNWIKGAIDAGDATKQFSQKTGVAAEDVAGLQLAFKQGGVEGDALTKSIAKLSKQMVEGNPAFDTLGVKTREVDGSMRSVKDVLYQTADAFKGMDDGARKAALAQEIFGKAGLDMIPTLNEGRAGMEKMADMAMRLGLTMSKDTVEAADQFNDTMELVGLGMTGVGRQVAAFLLPTLNNLAGSMLDFITTGDTVRKTSEAISAGLKMLYSAGVVLVEVFSTAGKTIGAAIAQVVAVMNGDFKQAAAIGNEWAKDVKTSWTASAKALEDAWSTSNNTTVTGLAAVTKKSRDVEVQTKAQTKAVDEAAKAYDSWNNKLKESGIELAAQLVGGEKLSSNQKALASLTANNTSEVTKLTERRRLELIELAKANIALERQAKALELEKKWLEETGKENDKFTETLEKQTEAIQKEVEKSKEANAIFTMTREATVALEIAKLNEQATTKDRLATWAEESLLGADLVKQYKDQAQGLRDLAILKGQKVHLEAAKEAGDAWKKTTDEIGSSFTDSLFRAFESGKSMGAALMDGLKNLFKTTVLKLVIQPVQNGMNNIIGNLLGSGGGGGIMDGLGSLLGMGGSGGGLGGLGTLGGIGASLGAFGSAAGYGMSALFGGTGMTALSGGASMLAAGSTASGLGMMAGVLGPIALGVGAIMAILKSDTSGTPHAGGTAYADKFGSGLTNGVDINFNTEKSYNAKIQSSVLQTSKSVADILNAFAGAAGGGNFRVSTGFQDDTSKDGAWGGLNISRDGSKVLDWRDTQTSRWAPKEFADGEQGWKDYMAAIADSTKTAISSIGLPEWAQSIVTNLGSGATLEQLAQAADGIAATQKALTAIGANLAPLGGVFAGIAGLSSDATMQLASFAGGIDAFLQKTQSFVDNYYSETERFGIQSKQLKDTLTDLGLDGSGLKTRDDFRNLLEAQTVTTEEGRKTVAALLEIAPAFAGVADYLTKNDQTLAQAAAVAPQVEALKNVFDQQARTTDATTVVADKQEVTNNYLSSIWDTISAGNSAVVGAVNTVAAAVSGLSSSLNDYSSRAVVAQPV